ncbi:MAG: hypothetical protein D5S00_05775 [Tindallia sp. MSAO_Bac2]|nr:MAG: hypothetical protein D5S00_05775 [Tindallia sp. MSAO_Bac2]
MEGYQEIKILDINLSDETVEERILSKEIINLYPDGSAFGMYLLLQEMDSGADPLSSSNLLIFTYNNRNAAKKPEEQLVITTKSPLNASVGDSKVESFFPYVLKKYGLYAMIFRGKAKKPVYFYMNSSHYEIRDAHAIWGKVTGESERIIKEQLQENELEMAQIGPAGENMIKYSCIITMTNRANGRSGTGAVMGSKNLKAIVLSKTK